MNPEFPLPEPDVPDVTTPPIVDQERYAKLLRASEERKASLEALQMSMLMLKEKTNATITAFREELTRAVRERVIAEANADVRAAASALVLNQQQAEARADVRRVHGQFRAVFNMLGRCVEQMQKLHPGDVGLNDAAVFVATVGEAHELMRTAGEYLD